MLDFLNVEINGRKSKKIKQQLTNPSLLSSLVFIGMASPKMQLFKVVATV